MEKSGQGHGTKIQSKECVGYFKVVAREQIIVTQIYMMNIDDNESPRGGSQRRSVKIEVRERKIDHLGIIVKGNQVALLYRRGYMWLIYVYIDDEEEG